jgi:hypothetical protein
VLHVDAQGIEALTRHDLRGEPVRDREPAHRDVLPGGKVSANPVPPL